MGHDEAIDFDGAAALVGDRELMKRVRDVSIALYSFAAEHARSRGVILADTKFEFGLDEHGELVLGDEVLTPDSSRYWPAEGFEVGRGQPSFDKQYVRDWASSSGWDKKPPAPEIPQDVVAGTRERYVEAYELIAGEPFADWLARTDAAVRARVLIRPKQGILDPQGEAVQRALPALGFSGVANVHVGPAGRAGRRGRRAGCSRCARSCSPTRSSRTTRCSCSTAAAEARCGSASFSSPGAATRSTRWRRRAAWARRS